MTSRCSNCNEVGGHREWCTAIPAEARALRLVPPQPKACEDPACGAPIDPNTDCCSACETGYGGPACRSCLRWGFHTDDCPEIDGADDCDITAPGHTRGGFKCATHGVTFEVGDERYPTTCPAVAEPAPTGAR